MASTRVLLSFAVLLASVADAQLGAFGRSVALGDLDGDGRADVVVGDPLRSRTVAAAGRVTVFRGGPLGPRTPAAWTIDGAQRGEHFGAVVVALGDLNGDGFDELIVSAPRHDFARPTPDPSKHATLAGPPTRWARDHGRVAVYPGSPTGPLAVAAWEQVGLEPDEHFGATLACGDLNGDGFDDLVIGATGTFGGSGAAFVFHGGPLGPSRSPDAVIGGVSPIPGTIESLAADGDVNGDGYDDLLLGRPDAPNGGRVLVHPGSPTGIGATSWEITDDGTNQRHDYGQAVAWAGDLDGDGFDEALIGDPSYFLSGGHGSSGVQKAGAVHLARGSAGGPLPSELLERGQLSQRRLGAAVAGVGDVDVDGREDLAFTGPGRVAGGVRRGRVEWRHRPANLTVTLAEDESPDAGTLFGWSLVGKRDVNGDGVADVVVGEPAPLAVGSRGRAYVYLGGAPGTGVWLVPFVLED